MGVVITHIQLMKEIQEIFSLDMPNPILFCRMYKDNESCIAIAKKGKN